MFEFPTPRTRLARSESSPGHAGESEGPSSFPLHFVCPCICCDPRSIEKQRSCIRGQQVAGGEEMEKGRNYEKPCLHALPPLLSYSLRSQLKHCRGASALARCTVRDCTECWKPVRWDHEAVMDK